jgi:hypothetical protein
MSKVFYERASKTGSTQFHFHKADKVSLPKSRKRGRGFISLSS